MNDLLTRGLLLAVEQQAHLIDVVGERPWRYDLDAGTLRFGDFLTFSVELLGTWAHGDSTFLWAWANEQRWLSDRVLRQALTVKAMGEANDDTLLTHPVHAVGQHDAFVLCMALAGVLEDVTALYRGPHGGGEMFLVVTDPQLALPPPTTIRTIRVLGEGMDLGLAEPEAAVDHYLTTRGFNLDKVGGTWTCTHPGGANLELEFNPGGRLVRMEGVQEPESL